MRKSLFLASATKIPVALVSSKSDYCNSLIHNIPENVLARLEPKAPRFSRSVPLLK